MNEEKEKKIENNKDRNFKDKRNALKLKLKKKLKKEKKGN